MAIANEHVASWTSNTLSQAIADRRRLGELTLVLDRRVVSNHVASDDLQADHYAPDTTVDLADASHWAALIVPEAERSQRDLQSFARALANWCAPSQLPSMNSIPDFAKATGGPRIPEIIQALYERENGLITQAIGDDILRHWRSALRDLGEGPRAVVDDPWFSHLFLSPTAANSRWRDPTPASTFARRWYRVGQRSGSQPSSSIAFLSERSPKTPVRRSLSASSWRDLTWSPSFFLPQHGTERTV